MTTDATIRETTTTDFELAAGGLDPADCVVVEYMPNWLRASHDAAGGWTTTGSTS